MDALLIIDMQVGSFEGQPPRHDAEAVIARINALIRSVRQAGGLVVFIQHGEPRGALKPGTPGWEILPALERDPADPVIRKTACDAFYETDLQEVLARHAVRRLIVTGCATDFCVDTTIRSAASKDYEVMVAADGHTTRDRPHLDAASIIKHHNWMWENLILPHSEVRVAPAEEILGELGKAAK